MSWTVDNIYNFVKYLTNKSQSGYVTPTDLFYAWNSEQRSYFSDMVGHFQARSNGKSGANTGLLENEVILTKLNPFTTPILTPVVAGKCTKSPDFIYGLACRINGEEVFMINKGQIPAVTKSVIDPPSVADNRWYATSYKNYYSVLPAVNTTMEIDYLSDPIDVIWGFDIVADRAVYNQNTSVQPAWDNVSIQEITKRTLKTLGVHFSSQDFENYGASVINTGN